MEVVLSRSVYRMESSLAEGCQLDSEGQSISSVSPEHKLRPAITHIIEHTCGCDSSSI